MLKLRREDVSPNHFQVYSGQVRIGTIYKASGNPEGSRDTSGGCKLRSASEEPCHPQKYGECGSPLWETYNDDGSCMDGARGARGI
jgi:hypothetical protein